MTHSPQAQYQKIVRAREQALTRLTGQNEFKVLIAPSKYPTACLYFEVSPERIDGLQRGMVHGIARDLQIELSSAIPGAILLPGDYVVTVVTDADEQHYARVLVHYHLGMQPEVVIPGTTDL